MCTTMLVEQVASELNRPGAELIDLADAFAVLKTFTPAAAHEIFGSEDWAAYFESRISSNGPVNAA